MTHSFSSLETPAKAGVSLKHCYYEEVIENKPAIDFFEVHSENYMSEGGCSLAWLEAVREFYSISLHGASLSLGTAQKLDKDHLKKLKNLIGRIDPFLVSDHLSWSVIDGTYLNDLLPIPYTKESLEVMSNHIVEAQDYLGRTLLIENPSSYLYFPKNEYSEPQFLTELVNKTGCKLLLDVNNIYVSSHNNKFDPNEYLEEIPLKIIEEIHLAGHNRSHQFYIDDHGCCVQTEVWELYKKALERFGIISTLIEWDDNIPELGILLSEAEKAKNYQVEFGNHERAA
ncbi:MAG: DUF692 domain-containing protein [Flavobacteriales bacterium]|nr:DUF692 domain-containing protein [Flavobacteriales bacterium]